MKFPSIFLFRSKTNRIISDSSELRICNNITIAFNKQIRNKISLIETKKYILLAHVNEAFKNIIQSNSDHIENLILNNTLFISYLRWGFFVIIDKGNDNLVLFNDPYGIYPLFYYNLKEDFIISNDLDGLINLLNDISFNDLGLYDYFLFNYTLKSRTILKEISQLEGGTYLEYRNYNLKITKNTDLTAAIFSNNSHGKIDEMADILKRHLHLNYIPNIPTTFPITGGFDSKVILSLLLSEKINFTAFTFGERKSDDFIAASSIANQYTFEHNFLGMTKDFLDSIDLQINEFLRCSPNAPMLDTLLYYQLTKERIQSSNLITGMMGGEIIVGPVLISELITTRSSAFLTSCRSRKELLYGLERNIKEQGIFNIELFKEKSDLYINPLLNYLKDPKKVQNENVIRFLLNETYAKFFGIVFSNMFSKCNIINPLVDLEFLQVLLNSEYSFKNKHPYSKAPLSHFYSRRLYPKLIKLIEPSVLKAKMDRGYDLEDFMKWYKFPRPLINYFRRHYLNKGKIISNDSLNYLTVLESIAVETVGTSKVIECEIFDKNSILQLIQIIKTRKGTSLQKQKLLQLFTICYFTKRYNKKISVSA